MTALVTDETSAELTVAADGQMKLPEGTLHHLGIEQGGKIELYLLPGGRIQLRPARTGKIEDFFGILAGRTNKVLTIEEINEASGPDLEQFR